MNPAHSPTDLASALVSDVRSLGLVSQTKAVLQDFSKRVLDSVRAIDAAVQVDEYSGHAFLDLISRLNQEVAPHLQQQATPPANPGPIHIWVIDQADQLSTEQQSIIFRLIELFPALPFRVIWLSKQPLQAWKEHTQTECVFLDLDAVDQPNNMGLDTPDPLDRVSTEHRDMTETASTNKVRKNATMAVALLGATLLGAVAWISASSPYTSVTETSAAPAAATKKSST